MNPLRETISWLKHKVQEYFFPFLQVCFTDPITVKQKQLITILEIVQVENHVKTPETQCGLRDVDSADFGTLIPDEH